MSSSHLQLTPLIARQKLGIWRSKIGNAFLLADAVGREVTRSGVWPRPWAGCLLRPASHAFILSRSQLRSMNAFPSAAVWPLGEGLRDQNSGYLEVRRAPSAAQCAAAPGKCRRPPQGVLRGISRALKTQVTSSVRVGVELPHPSDSSAAMNRGVFTDGLELLPTTPTMWVGRQRPLTMDQTRRFQCKLFVGNGAPPRHLWPPSPIGRQDPCVASGGCLSHKLSHRVCQISAVANYRQKYGRSRCPEPSPCKAVRRSTLRSAQRGWESLGSPGRSPLVVHAVYPFRATRCET